MQFNDLQLVIPNEIGFTSCNDKRIEVKTYLPVNDKLDLISWIINQSADELKFYNIGKIEVFKTVGLVKYYTNIEFTDIDLSNNNITIIYDLLISTGLFNEIKFLIPKQEIMWIDKVLMDTVDSIYKYQNSIFGILDAVTTDYKDLNFDISELQKNISNPENLTLLKDVVTKLG